MKPMTPDEFGQASDVKSIYEHNYTTIPPTIAKIHRQHFCTAVKVELWLSQIGCKTPYTFYAKQGTKQLRERLMKQTSFEIKIRHNNDYVECGCGFSDPKGEMFHIITPFRVEVKFRSENILYITQQLELFSEKKLPINTKLNKVNLEFYSCQRKIGCGSLDCSAKYGIKLSYNLEFEIKHVWKYK